MLTASDILKEMMDVGDEQIENIQSSIDQIQEQIDDYNEKINAIQEAICSVIGDDSTGSLTLYLDSTKVEEIELLYGDPGNTPFEIEYGENYNTIDYDDGGVTDFRILDVTANIVYEYNGTNWDNDPIIEKLVNDYEFANDYLTRPLITGASYGLIPNRDNLSFALSILNANKNKVENTPDVFNDYI